MIHAVVFKDQEDRIRGFELCGHAEYAQPGQDVVCAAVSMLAIIRSKGSRRRKPSFFWQA